jgi:hypothetical protein
MFYRIQIGTTDGLERGHQWRELEVDLFTQIITGQRPAGDADAQTRDSTTVRADAENRPMYYLAIWSNDSGWIDSANILQASDYYNTLGQPTPGV